MYGSLPGIPVGAIFSSRTSLYESGMHRNTRSHISVGRSEILGVESVVVAETTLLGGDGQNSLICMGVGGIDRSQKLVRDQELTGANLALCYNVANDVPVRVFREFEFQYEYVGLFRIVSVGLVHSPDQPTVVKYHLIKNQVLELNSGTATSEFQPEEKKATQARIELNRIDRSLKNSNYVKQLYEYSCQICGFQVLTATGAYSEGAHIVPVGSPFNGPDVVSNLLSLCPNHHVAFDRGGIFLDDEWEVLSSNGGKVGKLRIKPQHGLDIAFARQHRAIFGFMLPL